MNFFRDVIDKRAAQAISLTPSVQTGLLIDTLSVTQKSLTNPFFYALNSMNYLDGQVLLKQDHIKTGVSYISKDTNGVTRQEKVSVNPRWSQAHMLGSSTGKEAINLEANQILMADAVFSGSNNQTPTLIGAQISERKRPDAGTTVTPKDVTENTDASSYKGTDTSNLSIPMKIDPSQIGKGPITGSLSGPIGAGLPKLLDKTGKESTKQDKTGNGTHGNNIRTGTTTIPPSQVTSMMAIPR